jgi:hypothetical protein
VRTGSPGASAGSGPGLHREAAAGLPEVARLRDDLLAYPGMPARWRRPDPDVAVTPVLTMRLRRGDVALEQLRIECFYPADPATEETARRLARG